MTRRNFFVESSGHGRFMLWAMLVAFLVLLAIFVIAGATPLTSISSLAIATVLGVAGMISGYVEGLGVAYFIRYLIVRRGRRYERAKPVLILGLVLISLFSLVIFTWLFLITTKNVWHVFAMGCSIGVGTIAAASIRLVAR